MNTEETAITEHAPCSKFRNYIQSYWKLNCPLGRTESRHVISLNAGVEAIFNLSDPVECIVDKHPPITISRDFLVGSLAKKIQIQPTGNTSLFGVRFTPVGLYPFLSMPPVDLSDFCIEIEEVWELYGLGLSQLMHESTQEPESLIQAFEQFFITRISDFRSHSSSIEKATNIICSYNGQLRVTSLAAQLYISNRQLERNFTKRIGVTPKQLCRIIRVKHVLDQLTVKDCDLASLAVASGYFDQAHFNHEFKLFTGKSPRAYLHGY